MPGTQTPDSTPDAFASVTPSDGSDLAGGEARALWVGGAGSVAVRNRDGTAVTFSGVPAGSILPVRTSRVMATNTTATGIVALY
jgi:hypothetical protein